VSEKAKKDPSYFPCVLAIGGLIITIFRGASGLAVIGVAVSLGVYDLGRVVAGR
jgi:hypothetical protein